MKATVTQDLKSIYAISRNVYQEQPLLKRYVWRKIKIDIVFFLTLMVGIIGFAVVSQTGVSELVRNIGFGAIVVAFVYTSTLFGSLNYARMLLTADAALRGEQLTSPDVERVMLKRRSLLAKWVALDLAVHAAVSALQNLDEKIPFLGSILSLIGSLTWQTVSFFSLAIIVLHGEEPLPSVKQSASAVKETWKTGRLRYGAAGLFQAALGYLAMIIIFIVGLAVLWGGIALAVSFFADAFVLSAVAQRLLGIGVAVLAIPLIAYAVYLSAVIQAHYAVWQVALYRFAVHHDYVGVFPQELLQKAVEPVQKRRWFSRSKPA